jgi:hypothetical protein
MVDRRNHTRWQLNRLLQGAGAVEPWNIDAGGTGL